MIPRSTPDSNSSEQLMLSKTVVGVAQVMLAAHMNAEKSATDDGEGASKDPGGCSYAAPPKCNEPMVVGKVTVGCDSFFSDC